MSRQKNDGRGRLGGRVAGTPNKDKPLKERLRQHSLSYYTPSISVDDQDLADKLRVKVGDVVSMFDIDVSGMSPSERANMEEKLLRYHTPTMAAVQADINATIDTGTAALEERLRQLAGDD